MRATIPCSIRVSNLKSNLNKINASIWASVIRQTNQKFQSSTFYRLTSCIQISSTLAHAQATQFGLSVSNWGYSCHCNHQKHYPFVHVNDELIIHSQICNQKHARTNVELHLYLNGPTYDTAKTCCVVYDVSEKYTASIPRLLHSNQISNVPIVHYRRKTESKIQNHNPAILSLVLQKLAQKLLIFLKSINTFQYCVALTS
jgi:hypothetical protein